MAYKYGNRKQINMFPASIEEYVAEDDPVRAYDAFVEALDFNELGILIDENKVARKVPKTRCNWRIGKYMMRAGAANSFKVSKYGIPLVKPVAELQEETYTIVRNEDMVQINSDEIPNNGSLTHVRALQELDDYLADHPECVGQLQIMPSCEVVTNG